MKLIREVYDSVQLITEAKLGKEKEYFIEGIFLQSELKTVTVACIQKNYG